jgi:hypothetical protein
LQHTFLTQVYNFIDKNTSQENRMTAQSNTDSAAQALQQEVEKLQHLQDSITFQDIHTEVDRLDQTLNGLPAKLSAIRRGSYCYKSFLEEQVEGLSFDWQTQRNLVRMQVLEKQSALQAEAARIHFIHSRGATAGVALTSLENQISSAVQNLRSIYSLTQESAQRLDKQADEVAWTLEQIGQASFQLLPAEEPVEAVSARWKTPEVKDGLGGVLYLTDRRLIFEQKEEIVTKKVLFITTAKQKVQDLKWAIPVEEVQDAQGSKRGFLNKDDFLTITISAGKPFQSADIHLKGESGENWREYIQRVSNGALASERVGVSYSPAGSIEYAVSPENELAARLPQDESSLPCSAATRLNVGADQQAVLCYSGHFYDRLGPGAHTLNTSEVPLLAGATGIGTPGTTFPLQVYFVRTLLFQNISWGTIAPISVKAAGTESGVAQLKAYGRYSFSISDPVLFLTQLAGNGAHFTLDEMRSYILSAVTDTVGDLLSRQGRQISDLIYLTGDVAPSIAARVQEKMGSRGINLDQFTVEAINAENI